MSRNCISGFRALALLGLLLIGWTRMAAPRPEPQRIDLQFTRTEIQIVLAALASSVGYNLVVGPNVAGEVDVHLTNVDWEVALNTIVRAHGYRYFWDNDVLVVMSGESASSEGLDHRVITLRYADPVTIKNALVNVLSPLGKIELVGTPPDQATGKTHPSRPVIVLTEASHLLPRVVEVIDSLDVPVPQFEIGVKFIEADIDDDLGVGFGWPTRVDARVLDIDAITSNTTGGTTVNPLSQYTPAAEYPIPDGKIWRFGTLSVDQLTGFVEFLRQKGSARLLSDPSVTVLENETASMQVVTTIPVQTLNRFTEGAILQDIVDFQDLDVGITLTVVPRLNDSGQITLQVEPSVEEITGWTGPPDNIRPITATRTVKTIVRVGDGETLVIGGLVKETKFTTKSRVFLLGDIPILGTLFTHTSVQKKKTDLLIFITPRILADTE